ISGRDTSRMFKKLKKFLGGAVQVSPNLHVVTPVVIPYHGVKILAEVNALFLARYIKIHARRLGMSTFQLWTFMNNIAPYIGRLRPQKVIYYCVDEWSAFGYLDGQLMAKMEKEVIDLSDVVITSADELYESKRLLH